MAGGLFGGLFGTSGSPAQVVTTSPFDQMQQGGQSGNFNDLANTNSTYMADMFSQLGTGQAPSYYQSYQKQAMPYQQGLLNQQYFGTPGNRQMNGMGGPSGFGNAMTMASMFGKNPKAVTGMVDKNQLAYQNASSQLDQYFAGQGLNTIQETAKGLPGWATGQQDAFTGAFRPEMTTIPSEAGTQSPLFGLAGSIMGGPIGGMIGKAAGGMFNNMFNSTSAGR